MIRQSQSEKQNAKNDKKMQMYFVGKPQQNIQRKLSHEIQWCARLLFLFLDLRWVDFVDLRVVFLGCGGAGIDFLDLRVVFVGAGIDFLARFVGRVTGGSKGLSGAFLLRLFLVLDGDVGFGARFGFGACFGFFLGLGFLVLGAGLPLDFFLAAGLGLGARLGLGACFAFGFACHARHPRDTNGRYSNLGCFWLGYQNWIVVNVRQFIH